MSISPENNEAGYPSAPPPESPVTNVTSALGQVFVEAEDFTPRASASGSGWKVVFNGDGNYMVDSSGFNHISGERLLSAAAADNEARAVKTVILPEPGDYRVWSSFEQPTGTENRFRVEIRQHGRLCGAAVMGEKDTPKHFFGEAVPVAQADPVGGADGLAEQCFDAVGLEAGEAEITLVAIEQPEPAADRNVDFVFLTQDMHDSWRINTRNRLYPLLEAVQEAIPPRYYLRLTSPIARTIGIRHKWNRYPFSKAETNISLEPERPSDWIPLYHQDICHFSTLVIQDEASSSLQLRAEIATAPDDLTLLRAIDWNDPENNELLLTLPPYPSKYPGEYIQTVEEQYQQVIQYMRDHPSSTGCTPVKALNWATGIPVWERGRVAESAAALYHESGMRHFIGLLNAGDPAGNARKVETARKRFLQWNLEPSHSLFIATGHGVPSLTDLALARIRIAEAGVGEQLRLFYYGDEFSFIQGLDTLKWESINRRFLTWQQQHKGSVQYEVPDSSAHAAAKDPVLFVDSLRFYQDTALEQVVQMARKVTPILGPSVLWGANIRAHPWYYPDIMSFVRSFRLGATNFGRHSEFFWQVHQMGPLVNGYIAEHFHAGMRYNPQAVHQQYTMPHSPGNTDLSFRRSCFTHLAHGARGLDFFAIGLNHSFTENYIDFRDPGRYIAIRDVNRAMATIEDILPDSRPVPSKVALILSESTERWDLADISQDKNSANPYLEMTDPYRYDEAFYHDYKKARLSYHQERVGLYYALVHRSHPPDLLIEEDVQLGRLKDYEVAYWVGDCATSSTVQALSQWVQAGGHLVASGGALHYDEYRQPVGEGLKLLGLRSACLEERDRFFRPQIEMPYLSPLDWLGDMPALALLDTISPATESKVMAYFKSGKPAVVEHSQGWGKTTYITTLPGVAYLWSAQQPPPVPSRGPSSHRDPVGFNRDAGDWITQAVKGLKTSVDAHGAKIDARLLESPVGFAVPLANYEVDILEPVTLTIYGIPHVCRILSANRGELEFEHTGEESITLRYAPGVGDILRIENSGV